MDLHKIVDLAAPFSPPSPTGADARESDTYISMVEEFEHGQGLDTTPVNWSRVKTLAIDLLQDKSKDLNAANYLCAALYFEDGFEGLTVGFSLLEKLVAAEYWQDLFPPPKPMLLGKANKFRAACFPKMIKKLERPFADLEASLEQSEAIVACNAAFVKLDAALVERLEDKAPKIFEFRNLLGRFARDAEFLLAEDKEKQAKAEEVDASESAQQAETKQTSSEASAANAAVAGNRATEQTATASNTQSQVALAIPSAATVVSAADVEKALQVNLKTAANVAKLLREKKISNPYPYHLLRVNAWGLIDQLPADGVLPAFPSQDRIASLRVMEQNKQWETLIEECEKSFAGGAIYWVGFHRFVAIALGHLGAHDAAKTVKNSLVALFERFPEYIDRQYQGGDYFVDDLTKTWIETEGLLAPQEYGTSESMSGAVESWSQIATEAKKHAALGEFEQGIRLFRNGIQTAASEREHFYWLYEQAMFCMDCGHHTLALPQWVHLYQLIKEKRIDKWEPELYLRLIKQLISCYEKCKKKQKYSQEQLNQIEELRVQLCLHDPLSALSLN